MTQYTDAEIFGADEMGGIIGDIGKGIGKAAKSVGKAVGKAGKATGKFVAKDIGGNFAGAGKNLASAAKLVARGKIARAGAQAASAVMKVTSSKIIQTALPVAIVGNMGAHTLRDGPKGFLRSAKKAAGNPIVKAQIAAAAVVMPPVAPLSAAALIGTEVAMRTLENSKSLKPKDLAKAATASVGTQLAAQAGVPGAAEGLKAIKKVSGMANLLAAVKKGNPAARKAAAAINAKGGNDKQLAQILVVRDALKNLKHPNMAERARANAVVSKVQQKAPGLLAGVSAAMRVPDALQLGRFSVLRTGRILVDGKPIRKVVGSLSARK